MRLFKLAMILILGTAYGGLASIACWEIFSHDSMQDERIVLQDLLRQERDNRDTWDRIKRSKNK